MAKVVAMKSGAFDPETSAQRLDTELANLQNQFAEVTQVRKNDDGVEFPATEFTIDPEVKANIVRRLKFLQGVFMADKKLSNTGRAPKADLANLQSVYVEYMRANPKKNREMAAMAIALAYNNDRPEDQQIAPNYVLRVAKNNNWDALVEVPTVPATA